MVMRMNADDFERKISELNEKRQKDLAELARKWEERIGKDGTVCIPHRSCALDIQNPARERYTTAEIDACIAGYEQELRRETQASASVRKAWRMVVWALKLARKCVTRRGGCDE